MSKPYEILDAIVTKLLSHDTDYITGQGTSSGWKWRKWKSGKVEAWRTYTGTADAFSSWGAIYYRDITVPIANGIFSGAPEFNVTSFSNQHWVVSAATYSATAMVVRLGAPNTAAAYQPFLYIYAWEN